MAKNTTKTSALQMFNSIKKPVTNAVPAPQPKETEEAVVVKEEVMNAPVVPNEEVAKTETDRESATDIAKVDMDGFKMRRRNRAGRTVSFYMKDDVYNKLAELADSQGASVSECLDYILRSALLN